MPLYAPPVPSPNAGTEFPARLRHGARFYRTDLCEWFRCNAAMRAWVCETSHTFKAEV